MYRLFFLKINYINSTKNFFKHVIQPMNIFQIMYNQFVWKNFGFVRENSLNTEDMSFDFDAYGIIYF